MPSSVSGSFVQLARSISGGYDETAPEVGLVQPRNLPLSFFAVLACGTLNNFAYCCVNGAAQNLARQFAMGSQVTVLSAASNAACLAASLASTRWLLRWRFYTRVRAVLAMMAVAYAGVSLASLYHGANGVQGFALACLAACFAGFQQVVGEITNIAFLKTFPPQLIGGWGAGTGMAGILGSGTYIVLSGPFDLSNTVIFALMLPMVPLYWAAFHYLHAQVTSSLEGVHLAKALGGSGGVRPGSCGRICAPRQEDACGVREQLQPDSASLPATKENVMVAFRCSGGIMFNLVAVYCLEYTVFPGLVDRETLCSSPEWYSAMWMCYNLGVTLSRLSVALFRIQRVWMLTVFQLVNVIGWTAEVYTGAVRGWLPGEGGMYLMAAWMVLVGLCGGATYGNCMYLFNRQEGIPDGVRELGVNLGFFMSNIGITTATLSFSLLDETIMAKSVIYPQGC